MRRFFDKHMIVLTLLPVLAVMVMIFCFSSQNGEESGRTSAQVTEVVVHVTHPDYEQLPLAEKETIFARTMHAVRKSAHFSEFALLGFFLLGHFKALSIKLSLRYPALFSALAGMLYAASDGRARARPARCGDRQRRSAVRHRRNGAAAVALPRAGGKERLSFFSKGFSGPFMNRLSFLSPRHCEERSDVAIRFPVGAALVVKTNINHRKIKSPKGDPFGLLIFYLFR